MELADDRPNPTSRSARVVAVVVGVVAALAWAVGCCWLFVYVSYVLGRNPAESAPFHLYVVGVPLAFLGISGSFRRTPASRVLVSMLRTGFLWAAALATVAVIGSIFMLGV